jgi:DNA-binding winged helix-turn-helix (wHTH) protein
MSPRLVIFDSYELNLNTGELRRDGAPVPLEHQPARALVVLASRAGELVSRDELRRAIWDGDTFVDFDRGMNYCIRHLRAALGDDARRPRFIQTVPRQGYRFVAAVRDSSYSVETPDLADRPQPSRLRPWVMHGLTAAAAAVLTVLVFGGAASRIPSGSGRAHHDAAVAVVRTAHDALFGDAGADPSSRHRLAVAVTKAVHDRLFD